MTVLDISMTIVRQYNENEAAKPCPEFAHPAKTLLVATGMHQPGRGLPGSRCKAHGRRRMKDWRSSIAMLSCRPVQPRDGA